MYTKEIRDPQVVPTLCDNTKDDISKKAENLSPLTSIVKANAIE